MGLILTLFSSVTISINALTTLSMFFSTVLYFYPCSKYTNEKHLGLLMFVWVLLGKKTLNTLLFISVIFLTSFYTVSLLWTKYPSFLTIDIIYDSRAQALCIFDFRWKLYWELAAFDFIEKKKSLNWLADISMLDNIIKMC